MDFLRPILTLAYADRSTNLGQTHRRNLHSYHIHGLLIRERGRDRV